MMRRKAGQKLLGDRRVVGGFLLLIQLAIVMFGVSWASTEYHWLTPALTVLSVIIVIWLVRKYDNPMYKITWMLWLLCCCRCSAACFICSGAIRRSIGACTQHRTSRNRRGFH